MTVTSIATPEDYKPVPALRSVRQDYLNDTMTRVLRMWLSSVNPTYRRTLNSTYRRAGHAA